MIVSSLKFRGLILVAATAVFAVSAMASPLIFPPMPPTNPNVTAMASPLIFPPMPPTNPNVTAMASPLIFPPMPPTNPNVTV